MIVYDLTANTMVEFWKAAYDSVNNTWTAASTTRFYLDSNGLASGVTGYNNAGNFGHRGEPPSIRAVRVDEIKTGHIDHRLACYWWATGMGPLNNITYYWPMSGYEKDKGGLVPEGLVVRIKPSVDLKSRGLNPAAYTIAKALQDYGCMVGDNSGSGTHLDLEINSAFWASVGITRDSLQPIPWTDWEFVQGGYNPATGAVVQ